MSVSRSTITRRTALAAGLAAPFIAKSTARAQTPSRSETLLLVQEYGPNSLDMQGIGSSQPVNGVAINCYDRLIRFKPVPLQNGLGNTFNMTDLEPELAESFQVASDGMSATFKLRDAKFHSSRTVTAKDVKWSLDRAVSIGGFAKTQMAAGSLEKPEQFVALDDRTFRIDFIRRDKLTLPNLAVTIPFVIDSELAIKNGGDDPWAKDWLKNNVAGSGAFRIESWKPGNETVYVRNDAWTSGRLPSLRRVIARDVASPSTRRALIERGDADISYGLPPKDFQDLADGGKVKVVGVPVPNALWYLALNTATGPFTDVRLRRAVAWAMPYDKIFDAALFKRGCAHVGRARHAIGGLAAAFSLCDRSRQGKGTGGGGSSRRPENGTDLRYRCRDHRRTHGRAHQGSACADRHRGRAIEDRRCEFQGRAQQEVACDGDQPVRRLARFSGLLLLLEFPRQQFDLQHLELPEPCNGSTDRQRTLHQRPRRLCKERRGLRRACRTGRAGDPDRAAAA